MHLRFCAAIVLAALVGCGSGNSSTVRVMTDEERAAVEQRATAWRAERAKRQAAIERTAPAAARAAEAPAPEPVRTNPLLERLMDADGMGMCNIRLSDAARAVYGAGGLYRWTETQLEARFPRKRPAGGDVTTYIGDAIEFMDEDGSWLRAVYECDYDHDAGEIVDVRTGSVGVHDIIVR